MEYKSLFIFNLAILSPHLVIAIYLFFVAVQEKRFSTKIGLNKSFDCTRSIAFTVFPLFTLGVYSLGFIGEDADLIVLLMTLLSVAGLILPLAYIGSEISEVSKAKHSLDFFFGFMNHENQERFENVFELSPYENGSKQTFHRFKKDANFVKLASVANLYQELKTLTDIEKALPPRHRMQEDSEKQKLDELQKQIAKTKQVLKENAFVVKESIQGTANCTYTVQQLEAFKKLEALPLKSSSPKLYTDPTLEELQQIMSIPNVSTTLMSEAKELEKEVRKKLEEKKELLSQDESIESRLRAIKMFHNLQS